MKGSGLASVAKTFVLRCFILCVVVQALIPIGLMPASMSSGTGFFQICPVQQPQLLQLAQPQSDQQQHTAHAHHHEHSTGIDHQVTNDCQWGQAIFALFLSVFFWLLTSYFTPLIDPFSRLISAFRLYLPPIRAPPRLHLS